MTVAPPPRPPVQAEPLKAALWMTGSILGFTVLAISGRQIGTALDPYEIMFYRSAIGIVTVLAAASLLGTRGEISTRHMHLHILRNLSHFAGQVLWLTALLLIPLAQLFAMEFSYPIIVALLAPLFLGERLTQVRMISAALGFAGILLVARPFGGEGLSFGLIAAVGCAFGFAGSAIVTKRLTRVASVTCILFWLAVIQCLLGLGFAARDGAVALPPVALIPWVVLIGLSGLVAHLSLTRALSLAPATVVTPIDFTRLPLIGVVGMALYGEPLDLWVFLGGAVIFAANWINLRSEASARTAIR
ncbi:MAG: DMT family transporter [Rhodobacteraceae bacterium]|nr:DMT family transporter [Paracoccaceae bacterium]